MPSGDLHRYFLNNADKAIFKWVHYLDIYERHFERFRGKSPVMMEIGVLGGGSLTMWKDYFGEGCQIVGVDIEPDCKQFDEPNIEIFIGSQDDPALIESILARYPRIDIVLDDGSHQMSHMAATFGLLYHRVHANGVYVVEDTHTCYWPEYEGGLGQPASFMEFTKAKLDELNAVHTRGALPMSDFTTSTACVACYDSVIVFERAPQGQRQSIMTGPM